MHFEHIEHFVDQAAKRLPAGQFVHWDSWGSKA